MAPKLSLILGVLLATGGCGAPLAGDTEDPGAGRWLLAPLDPPPTFSAGTLSITVEAGDTAVISRASTTASVLVNDVVTTGATGSTVKKVLITGSSGNETVVVDLGSGVIGTSSGGPAITIDLGGGDDTVSLRGSNTLGDVVSVSGSGTDAEVRWGSDALPDVRVRNPGGTVALQFALGGGHDRFTAEGFTGDVEVFGGAGDDTLTGGAGNDVLHGEAGKDVLSGGSVATDADVLDCGGAASADPAEPDTATYAGRLGPVRVTVGASADPDGESGESDDVSITCEVIRGGSGDDTLVGGAGDQTLYGGPGDDTFDMGVLATSGAGNDTVWGEAGTDTVDYASRTAAVRVTMDLNRADDGDAATGEQDTVRDDVENLRCPAAGCTATGNNANNRFLLGAGKDVVSGGAGDDVFVVGAASGVGQGADELTGGAGIDTVDFQAFGAPLSVRLDWLPSPTMSRRIDVERLYCPLASACTAVGGPGANHLVGSSTVDVLSGGDGDDLIETGGGSDTVDCGDGSDILIGATASDTGCEL